MSSFEVEYVDYIINIMTWVLVRFYDTNIYTTEHGQLATHYQTPPSSCAKPSVVGVPVVGWPFGGRIRPTFATI